MMRDENPSELRASAIRCAVGPATEPTSSTGAVTQGLWRALLDGRARVVDRFRIDGVAYLVAKQEERLARASLSPRERQVVIAAASGQALKGIAFDLDVTTSTVGNHLRSVTMKTGLAGRKEIAFWFSFFRGPTAEALHG